MSVSEKGVVLSGPVTPVTLTPYIVFFLTARGPAPLWSLININSFSILGFKCNRNNETPKNKELERLHSKCNRGVTQV
jgi:hypothetical protein